jgi:methylthioribose-1-phosphate isomerase
MSTKIEAINWNDQDQAIELIDQRYLPHQMKIVRCDTVEKSIKAISEMVVRGAPCIGFTGIFAVALAIKESSQKLTALVNREQLNLLCEQIKQARPTAVNLAYEVNRTRDYLLQIENSKEAFIAAVKLGLNEMMLSESRHFKMAEYALDQLERNQTKQHYNILTHCNTGRLACGSWGTALGVAELLQNKNRLGRVWVDETRPYMQGSRLTAYELSQMGADYQIITDSAAAYVFSHYCVDAVFVGADRIALNGDTANKIGTYNLSIIAKNFNVPFYVVAPLSTFDIDTLTGAAIKIEMRDPKEILNYNDLPVAPSGAKALNPSFDVTPFSYISGIICEKGIINLQPEQKIKQFLNEKT